MLLKDIRGLTKYLFVLFIVITAFFFIYKKLYPFVFIEVLDNLLIITAFVGIVNLILYVPFKKISQIKRPKIEKPHISMPRSDLKGKKDRFISLLKFAKADLIFLLKLLKLNLLRFKPKLESKRQIFNFSFQASLLVYLLLTLMELLYPKFMDFDLNPLLYFTIGLGILFVIFGYQKEGEKAKLEEKTLYKISLLSSIIVAFILYSILDSIYYSILGALITAITSYYILKE